MVLDEEKQPVNNIATFKRFSGTYEKFIATYFQDYTEIL